jgi:immune inhibitor A
LTRGHVLFAVVLILGFVAASQTGRLRLGLSGSTVSPTAVSSALLPTVAPIVTLASTPTTAVPTVVVATGVPIPTANLSPVASPSVSPSIVATTSSILVGTIGAIPSPPPRNLYDLQLRLRSPPPRAVTPAAFAPRDEALGSDEPFWVANEQTKSYFQITARVVLKTDHVLWYEQDGVDIGLAGFRTASSFFETKTYPTERSLFGQSWAVGLENGHRVTILVAHVPQVGGYYSNADEYPLTINPYSNQREMIYINADAVRPGVESFNSTVAHEFMHLIQFHVHPNQNSWINEGSAELAAQAVAGAVSSGVRLFERAPATQLTAWASDSTASLPHYGAAYLFMRYLAEQSGGFDAVGRLVAEPGRSIGAFQQFLGGLNPPRTFESFFADWVAANYLNDRSLGNGRYGYDNFQFHPTVLPGPAVGQTIPGRASQFGAIYYRVVSAQPATLTFRGATSVSQIGGDPHQAQNEWWSNRGDSIDTRLTRSVDLTGRSAATLQFWIWFDIERGYDYGYVEASTNGGATWATLAAQDTTADNPNGQNYGNGFTGTSGGGTPTWLHETVDLAPYLGKQFQLRFEYVTDESYNGDGFALDGIAIPEANLNDNAESDAGWQVEGFTRIANRASETYLVEALDSGNPEPVQRVVVGSDGQGTLPIEANHPIVLAVTGLAPRTTQLVGFELGLTAR